MEAEEAPPLNAAAKDAGKDALYDPLNETHDNKTCDRSFITVLQRSLFCEESQEDMRGLHFTSFIGQFPGPGDPPACGV